MNNFSIIHLHDGIHISVEDTVIFISEDQLSELHKEHIITKENVAIHLAEEHLFISIIQNWSKQNIAEDVFSVIETTRTISISGEYFNYINTFIELSEDNNG